ncbi:hypothetical protein BBP40_012773 [Aspergillus hancockii]|nr:hypothetical protein BBP40_012773 [Aspergillus hancockii]
MATSYCPSHAILEGIVLKSTSAAELALEFPLKGQRAKPSESTLKLTNKDEIESGTVALIFPPKRAQSWTLKRILLAAKLWALDWLDPVTDLGANEKRVSMLFDAHDKAIDAIKSRYTIDDLWYLEVVAVHPSLQGRGLGRVTMNSISGYIGHHPIVLECTAKQNVGFYESLGFEVVEELDLVDGDAVKCWIMLRQSV